MGDVNYLEYGGILLMPESDTCFAFVDVSNVPDIGDHIKHAVTGVIDITDDWIVKRTEEIRDFCDISPKDYDSDIMNNANFAAAAITCLGTKEFSETSIVCNSLVKSLNPYFVLNSELCTYLNDIGFECVDEEFEKFKTMNTNELASEIVDYMNIRGEFESDVLDDFITQYDEDNEFDEVATIERVDEILNKGGAELNRLSDYFKGDISVMAKEDELIQKAVYIVKILEPRIEQKEITNSKDRVEKGKGFYDEQNTRA